MSRLNVKNEVNEVFYFNEGAKNKFLDLLQLPKDVKMDFDVNYEWYKLKNKNLVVNDAVKYTFKTQKEFIKVCHAVIFEHVLFELKRDYQNITIFYDFSHYTKMGNPIFKINVFANFEKQNRILNITYKIAEMRACKGFNAVMSNGALLGDDIDSVYIQKMLNDNNINCFR